jgi:hypothetical protein
MGLWVPGTNFGKPAPDLAGKTAMTESHPREFYRLCLIAMLLNYL